PGTPSDTPTPTDTPTKTPSNTPGPGTPSDTPTATDTPTPAPFSHPVIGPVPVKPGDPVCVYYGSAQHDVVHWDVYNLAGDLVATLNYTTEPNPCWTPPVDIAAGIYMCRIEVTAGGSKTVTWQKVAIRR